MSQTCSDLNQKVIKLNELYIMRDRIIILFVIYAVTIKHKMLQISSIYLKVRNLHNLCNHQENLQETKILRISAQNGNSKLFPNFPTDMLRLLSVFVRLKYLIWG